MNSTTRLAVTSALLAVGAPALAQDKVSIRMADYLPPNHYLMKYGGKPWIEAVTKQSGGRIDIKHFPSEQLGKAKDLLSLTQSGVADMSGVVPGFVSDRLPLSTVSELPGQYKSSCHGTVATAPLVIGQGILAREETDKLGVVPLFTIATPPYNLFSRREKLATLDDVKGLKVRTLGGGMTQTFQKLGAVGVQMALPEIYESLSRGTVDGLAYPFSPLISGGFQKIVKSVISDVYFGGANFTYFMNAKKWNALPADVKQVLLGAGEETMKAGCAGIDKDTDEARGKAREAGVQFFQVSAGDKAKLEKIMDELAQEWVRDVGAKRGKSAEAVYRAYRESVVQTN
jgi:TRAP-type C4-dicarboxylate transport system substrate-binding protein